MKPRKEYKIVIEYFIPERSIPGSAEQRWEYLMAIFRDVHAAYPGAGITVTCTKGERRLDVTGVERAPVEALISKSEQQHRYW